MSAGKLRARVQLAVQDKRVVDAVHLATLRKVDARAAGMAELRNHEELRTLAEQIKRHTLEHLPQYLEQFVAQARAKGAQLHFAPDAAAARTQIVQLARDYDLHLAVKVKSMTTEEVELNAALEAAGLRVYETDLGEFIVQLDHDRPSHIVTPIIHKDRRQVAAAMTRELGVEYTEDAETLTRQAREFLRDIFRRCDLGISGANFAVAETGTLCLLTNEGNGRMSTTRPRVHIALVGIEKLIPRLSDLAVYLKLLSRSSTGQPMGSYTTMITGPRRAGDADGPEHLHIILLDNGRSALLGTSFQEVLHCIRCGACLNACPVYRNIGGHAYNSVYPGPIGSLVTPLLDPAGGHHELPRASSLCGACYVVCPVKINIPELLVRLRAVHRDRQPWSKRFSMRAWQRAMLSETTYRWGQAMMRGMLTGDVEGWVSRGPGAVGEWTSNRDLRGPAPRSFRQCWEEGLKDET